MSEEHTLDHPASEAFPLAARRAGRRVVAITGAAGFLGENLIGCLEEDRAIERVVSIDTTPPRTAQGKTRLYQLDLTQSAAEDHLGEILAAEGADTLVHLAFLPSPTHTSAYCHEFESIGTLRALNACRRSHVSKFVMWSQSVLYGARPDNPNFLSEQHALRARSAPFFLDKIDAEDEALRFGTPGRGRVVTILRTAPIVGPSVDNYLTRYLSHRIVPTVLGFDPLWQFLHEADAVRAFHLAVTRDLSGVFNVAPEGVLPLSTAVRLAGRSPLPLPRRVADAVIGALWLAQVAEAPAAFIDYLQYLCVVDGEPFQKLGGFRPLYTSREALTEYAAAQHLRDVRLLSETAA